MHTYSYMQAMMLGSYATAYGVHCGWSQQRHLCDLAVLLAQSAGLSNFAWGHECSRQDTLSGLAVKYGVTPLAIKMTNNLISDRGVQSRHIVYVPGQHEAMF